MNGSYMESTLQISFSFALPVPTQLNHQGAMKEDIILQALNFD